MLELVSPLFRNIYESTGINFIIFYDEYEYNRFINGIFNSIELIFLSILLSLFIGVVGAWAQGSNHRSVRWAVGAYIQIFRNTPIMVQLLFFYFGLGHFTPQVDMGGYQQPLITAFAWAVISIGIFGGAFNAEIFRSGLEAVPKSTHEAAESLGFTRFAIYFYITLPLAFRISLPALTNNIVSLAKTSSLAYVISVQEVTYTLNQIWADNLNVTEMMSVLFVYYIVVVSVLAALMHRLERVLALPGFGK